jgi:hypothetical protein
VETIRQAIAYYPVPKPITVVGRDGVAFVLNGRENLLTKGGPLVISAGSNQKTTMADEQILLIANFNKQGGIERWVTGGGVTISVKVGPQSFAQVGPQQVGTPPPWTIAATQSAPNPLQINSLPAIAAYGTVMPSGAGRSRVSDKRHLRLSVKG